MTSASGRPGRPRRSSRETIEDAAAELFLEQGYARTSVDQIAQRAGVSRASFFNYFAAKSDVLWIAVDEVAPALAGELRARPEGEEPAAAVRAALLAVADRFGPERAPWAVIESDAMGIGDELGASALPRFAAQAEAVSGYLTGRGMDGGLARSLAAAVLAAAATAALDWARAGQRRGPLTPCIDAAISPLLSVSLRSTSEASALAD